MGQKSAISHLPRGQGGTLVYDVAKLFYLLSMPHKVSPMLLCLALLSGCSLTEVEVSLSASDVAYVYDGDTITFYCITDFHCENNKTKVRVRGVDTPEIKADCEPERVIARQAKQHTVNTLRNAQHITLKIDQFDTYDRYDRLLAYVYIDGVGLHDSLIKRKLGRAYQGGKRVSWC